MSLKFKYKGKEIKIKDCERQPCEVWSRVMGYFRPIDSYNKGKLSEHSERNWFKENTLPHWGKDE